MFLTIYEGKLNIVKNIGTQIYKVCEIAFQLSVKKITYLTNEMVRIGALNCLQGSVLVNWHLSVISYSLIAFNNKFPNNLLNFKS
jgi:hypothetical protein